MDRSQLINRLEKAWDGFKASYAGLSEAEMLTPDVTGAWSVKDILAHVTSWEEQALTFLPQLLEGKKPPRYSVIYGGIDAFNAQTMERTRGLPLPEVLRRQQETHRRLLAFLQQVPEDQFYRETPFRHRLRLDTYHHYREHAEAIAKWRESPRQPG